MTSRDRTFDDVFANMLSTSAAAQAGGVYVNAVDLVIVPSEMSKFVEAIKDNASNAVKEPGLPRIQRHGAGKPPEPRLPLRGL